MTYESGNIGGDIGELKLEFLSEEQADSDIKFTNSVRNLLVLVKDFYGADSAVVYWFNKTKKSFKLLASSEDDSIDLYNERFDAGPDTVSELCLSKRSDIINLESDDKRRYIRHLKGDFKVRSIIANPLIFDDEVIAIVLCESKTLNFFGTPNLYTLRVFCESITNYIKYYSLNEDFEYEDKVLRLLASNKLGGIKGTCDFIRKNFERAVDYDFLAIAGPVGNTLRMIECFWKDELKEPLMFEDKIEDESLCYKSFSSGKIMIRNFGQNDKGEYRFSKKESYRSSLNFCSIPVFAGKECVAVIAFETAENLHGIQKKLGEAYKLCYPLVLLLNIFGKAESSDTSLVDRESGFYNSRYFDLRMESDLSKNRLFGDSSLYCIFTGIDNIGSFAESSEIKELFQIQLKKGLGGYDMIFKLDTNKYAVLVNVSSDEKVFLELEKIRKSVSSTIHNIDSKEISYTASFAIKKYDDLNMPPHVFLKELDSLFVLAGNEGGNCVKI